MALFLCLDFVGPLISVPSHPFLDSSAVSFLCLLQEPSSSLCPQSQPPPLFSPHLINILLTHQVLSTNGDITFEGRKEAQILPQVSFTGLLCCFLFLADCLYSRNIETERAKSRERTRQRHANETPAELMERRRRHREAQARYREANRLQLRTKSWQDRYVYLYLSLAQLLTVFL